MNARIYARFSPRRNAENCESISAQVDFCRDYCSKNSLEVVQTYTDEALSGADEDRPGLWAAVESLKAGECLVVYKLDRLARDVYLAITIEREVEKRKAKIVSVVEGESSNSPQDTMIRQVIQAFSEYERKVIAARTKAAMLRHQSAGRRMSAIPPYGMRIDPSNSAALIEHQDEQAQIKRIVAMKAKGATIYAIATALNADSTCRGTSWHRSTISRIISRVSAS